jgi:hypothetical protein
MLTKWNSDKVDVKYRIKQRQPFYFETNFPASKYRASGAFATYLLNC